MAGAALCLVTLYSRPLVHLPPEVLSPMQRWLAMPHGKSFSAYGAIAVLPWLLLCDRASGMVARAMLPARKLQSGDRGTAKRVPSLASSERDFLAEGKKER